MVCKRLARILTKALSLLLSSKELVRIRPEGLSLDIIQEHTSTLSEAFSWLLSKKCVYAIIN